MGGRIVRLPTRAEVVARLQSFVIAGRCLRADLDHTAAPVVHAALGHWRIDDDDHAHGDTGHDDGEHHDGGHDDGEDAATVGAAVVGRDRTVGAGTAIWQGWASAAPHPAWVPDAAGPLRRADGALASSSRHPPFLDSFEPLDGAYRLESWGASAAWASGEVAAHPGHLAIAAWLATTGAHVLHGAAVSVDGRGVLLVGPGGAGKSTTAIAMAAAGATLLADDLCIVERDTGEAVVHPLYRTCKLNADSDARLEVAASTLGWTAGAKRVVAMDGPLAPGTAVPVAAVVILRPPGALGGEVRRESPARAAAALGATGLLAALGAIDVADWFGGALALARRVPAYAIELTWDLGRLTDAIAATAGARS